MDELVRSKHVDEEEVKASYKGRFEEEGSFNTTYSGWTSWFDDQDQPKHFDNTSVIWYMEANVTKFGVYCVMELGSTKPPSPPPTESTSLGFHLHRAHRPHLLHHGQT